MESKKANWIQKHIYTFNKTETQLNKADRRNVFILLILATLCFAACMYSFALTFIMHDNVERVLQNLRIFTVGFGAWALCCYTFINQIVIKDFAKQIKALKEKEKNENQGLSVEQSGAQEKVSDI